MAHRQGYSNYVISKIPCCRYPGEHYTKCECTYV